MKAITDRQRRGRGSSIQFSKSTAEELSWAFALMRSNMLPYHEKLNLAWDQDWIVENYRDKENYSISLSSRWKGFLSLEYLPESIFVHTLQVIPENQGGTIGIAAFDWLVSLARERSVQIIECKTFRDNPAVNIYNKLGFTVQTEDRRFLTLKLCL